MNLASLGALAQQAAVRAAAGMCGTRAVGLPALTCLIRAACPHPSVQQYAQYQLYQAWQHQNAAHAAAAAAAHAAANCCYPSAHHPYPGHPGGWDAGGAYATWDAQPVPHQQHGPQITELPCGADAQASAIAAAESRPAAPLPLPAPAQPPAVPAPAELPVVDVDSPFWVSLAGAAAAAGLWGF